ncbi:MAG TPA: thioredoxin family protein [Verrucomicrobiae bacterium]|jgi:protein disulfide-isomerase
MKIFTSLVLSLITFAAAAAPAAYPEAANAKLDIQQALTQATTNHTPVIVVFGANWCPDCQMLAHAIKDGASAPLLAKDFKVVKVNVGHFDQNQNLAKYYDVPLAKGIPAVVILSTNNVVLYATREGELASAQKMGDDGIYQFFKRVTASPAVKP